MIRCLVHILMKTVEDMHQHLLGVVLQGAMEVTTFLVDEVLDLCGIDLRMTSAPQLKQNIGEAICEVTTLPGMCVADLILVRV